MINFSSDAAIRKHSWPFFSTLSSRFGGEPVFFSRFPFALSCISSTTYELKFQVAQEKESFLALFFLFILERGKELCTRLFFCSLWFY